MKTCSKCLKKLPLNSFHKNLTKSKGRASVCRQCQAEYCRKWRASNGGYKKTTQNNHEYYTRFRNFLSWIRASLPCANCKKHFQKECMEFDHLLLRHMDRSKVIGKYNGIKHCLEELVKCRVLCSNCHALRTAQQRECKWNLAA